MFPANLTKFLRTAFSKPPCDRTTSKTKIPQGTENLFKKVGVLKRNSNCENPLNKIPWLLSDNSSRLFIFHSILILDVEKLK